MKIALVNLFYTKVSLTDHLGLGSIAAYLRGRGYEASLHFLEPDLLDEQYIVKHYSSYQVCAFPLFTMNAKYVYFVANILKKVKPNMTIIVGGHLATLCASNVLDDCASIDAVILGDGEEVFFSVVKNLEKNKPLAELEHVVTRFDREEKKPAIVDITRMPMPARDNLELSFQKGNTMAQIIASRGCCANCSFCSANCYARKWRGRDIEDVFKEIILLYQRYGVRCFAFNDASLEDPGTEGKARLIKLAKLLQGYPVKFAFRCFFRSESFYEQDKPLILELKKAGFAQVFIGFEAANERDLNVYGKRSTKADNIRVMKLFREAGIAVLMGFIMLNPYSTRETVKQNYLFLSQNGSYTYGNYISKIELDYHTKLYYELRKAGLLKPDYSYLNPFSYYFQNGKIQEISDFLEEMSTTTNILDCDGDYAGFVQVFHNLESLYPEKATRYVKRFQELKLQIAKELADYFYIIYVEGNLRKARENWNKFYEGITGLYNKAKMLTIHMAVQKEFGDILYNNLGKRKNE